MFSIQTALTFMFFIMTLKVTFSNVMLSLINYLPVVLSQTYRLNPK